MNTTIKTIIKLFSGMALLLAIGIFCSTYAKAEVVDEFDLKADKVVDYDYEYVSYRGTVFKEFDKFVKVTFKTGIDDTSVYLNQQLDEIPEAENQYRLNCSWSYSNFWSDDNSEDYLSGYYKEGVAYLIPGEYEFEVSNYDEKDRVHFVVEEADVHEFVFGGTLLEYAFTNETYDLSNNCYKDAKYETTDSSVAVFDEKGLLTIVGAGSCKANITSGKDVVTYNIAVKEPNIYFNTDEGYAFGDKIPVGCKGSSYLDYYVIPAGMEVVWSGDNKNIASVSKDGIINAKRTGNVTVTAKQNGKIIATKKLKIVANVFKQKLDLKNKIKDLVDGDTWDLQVSKLKYNKDGSVTAIFYICNTNASHQTATKFGENRVEIYVGDKCIGKQSYKNIIKNFPYKKYVKQKYTIAAENVRAVKNLVAAYPESIKISTYMTKMEWK